MKRATVTSLLILLAYLFIACTPTVPITRTGSHLNRYKPGRTFGAGQVHVTMSLQSVPVIREEGNELDNIGSYNEYGESFFVGLTVGLTKRLDVSLGGGSGSGGLFSADLQYQVTPVDQPFALSVNPFYSHIQGNRDRVDGNYSPFGEPVQPHTKSIAASTSSYGIDIPASFRIDRHVEPIWSVGWRHNSHGYTYSCPHGTRESARDWNAVALAGGIRLGFLTLQVTSAFDEKNRPDIEAGAAARFRL